MPRSLDTKGGIVARNFVVSLLTAAVFVVPATAAAQSWGEVPDPDATDAETPDEPVASPAPAPVQPVAPPPASRESAAPPPPARTATEPNDNRPEGTSVGIGAGYTIPADILNPNTASVRFRFPSGLTFEPLAVLATQSSSQEFMGAESENKQHDFAVATEVRWPVGMRGKVDLVLLGGAGISVSKTLPDGADNDTTRTDFALSWGLGLDYWPKPRWAISASATNPLFLLSKTSQEVGDETREDTTVALGAVFDPGFRMMLHMFF